LRNFCDVFLCRINIFTSKLFAVKQLKYNEILPNGCEFNPNQSLIQMRGLFEKLQSLDAGNYLLMKEVNEDKLNIFKSNQPKSGAFDLHFFYNGFNVEEKEKPHVLMSIDTETYLQYQITMKKSPCLFEPIIDKEFKKQKEKQSPLKKNMKRRKKK